jgi:hypothetical protein
MAGVTDIYRIAAVGSCFGQRIMLTHAYHVTAVVGVPLDDTIGNELLTALKGGVGGGDTFETLYRACLPSQYSLDYWRVQLIRPFRLAFKQADRAVVGTHADDTRATNQAAVITLRSAYSGRWANSNKHIGPVPQAASAQISGEISGAYKTKLELLGAGMLSTIVTANATFQPIIVHPPADHLGSTPLIAQSVQTTLRVMRRRTVRVGE